jgi:hypothetical protein
MSDTTGARRQISLLTARVAAAERAAGMSDDDVAKAERAMERHVRERQQAADGEVTEAVLTAFRLSALHIRLRDAEDYRITRKKPARGDPD